MLPQHHLLLTFVTLCGHDDYATRETATLLLSSSRLCQSTALVAGASSADPEIRARCARISGSLQAALIGDLMGRLDREVAASGYLKWPWLDSGGLIPWPTMNHFLTMAHALGVASAPPDYAGYRLATRLWAENYLRDAGAESYPYVHAVVVDLIAYEKSRLHHMNLPLAAARPKGGTGR